MENGSKALIMAAEVLLGVMIISLGVYVFNMFGEYSKDMNERLTDSQIAEFNYQYLKYYGESINDEGDKEPIKCTIHDIASIANLAQKNNSFYQVEDEEKYSQNSAYIQIDIGNKKNIEKYSAQQIIDLIKANDLISDTDEVTGTQVQKTKYYRILNEENGGYIISDVTKKIIYMKFVEL